MYVKTIHNTITLGSITVDCFYIQSLSSGSKNDILEDMFMQIKNTPNFNLGEYSTEERLKEDLERKIFGKSKPSFLLNHINYHTIVLEKLKSIFEKSFKTVPVYNNINCYILPLYDKESSDEMNGVNAFVTEGNMMYLLIDRTHNNWEKSLLETIPHEYAHIAYTSKFPWNSILDGIINEGIAEHFRESLVGGDHAPWSIALDREYALSEFSKISESDLNLFIDENNLDFYLKYFFGTGNLQNWYGYSIGYWVIDEVLIKSQKNIFDLFNMSPVQIFELFKNL